MTTIPWRCPTRRFAVRWGWLMALTGLLFSQVFSWQPQEVSAAAALTITPVTWDVIGLDSNKVADGPNSYPVGARVCNTGTTAATNVTSSFVWDPITSTTFISLTGPMTLTTPSLAAGACTDFYYNAVVNRSTAAYDTVRPFHITASADLVPQVTTPLGRQLYVQHLVSQNRNSVTSITGPNTTVPNTVYVGQTYQYTVTSSTSTNGYDQLFDFLDFPNSIFHIASVAVSYTAPVTTGDTMYADACGWDNTPTDPSYNRLPRERQGRREHPDDLYGPDRRDG